MLLRLVHLGNDTYVKWSQGDLENKKYFIVQFSINHTHPHPAQLLDGPLRGTVTPVEEKPDEIRRKLTVLRPLNQSAAATVLRNAEHEVLDNEVDDVTLEMEEDIYSLVLDDSATGLLLQHFSRIKMRVLIITSENEFLAQDFRYVQWKIVSRLYCSTHGPSPTRAGNGRSHSSWPALIFAFVSFFTLRSRMAPRTSRTCRFA